MQPLRERGLPTDLGFPGVGASGRVGTLPGVNELLGYTLVELAEVLRLKRASPVELMEATLARIDETNPKLNAVVAMVEREKLWAAAGAAAERISNGEARALEGVPLATVGAQPGGAVRRCSEVLFAVG